MKQINNSKTNTLAPILKHSQVDLSVVIVTYNCKNYVLECLESIFAQAGPIQIEVIVVDNASKDGTAKAIQEVFPNVCLIKNNENRWFRPAVNQGVRQSQGRYVLLLGPDTHLLTSGGLARMVQYMDAHQQVGILGVKLLNPDGTIQLDCDRFPGLGWVLCHYFSIHQIWPLNPIKRRWRYDGWGRQDTRAVDTVSGACMMIRRQVFKQIGLLDERCLMYWEEAELCRAAHKANWQVVHLADVEVLHYWQQGGVSITPAQTVKALMEESILLYYRKYYGLGIYWFLLLLSRCQRFISKVLKTMKSHISKDV